VAKRFTILNGDDGCIAYTIKGSSLFIFANSSHIFF
jgi:hypothetical protein